MSSQLQSAQAQTQFTVALICHRCGQTGSSVWEEESSIFARGRQTFLISLSDGFYERLARKRPHVIELFCHGCEAVQRN